MERNALPPGSNGLSRRRFLGGSAATAAWLASGTPLLASLLASCGNDGDGGSGEVTDLTFIVPGDQPAGWSKVLDAVNEKLAADRGLRFDLEWIGWSNYADTSLLKHTSGETFDGSLDAAWLHMQQLAQDGALLALDDHLASGDYPELTATIDPKTIESSKIDGKLWGVPQVNNASVVTGFTIRRDLADAAGFGEISSYEDFERFLYDVKQQNSSVIPYGLDNGYVNNTVGYHGVFTPAFWSDPNAFLPFSLGTIGAVAYARTSEAQAGSVTLLPFWEVPGLDEAMRLIRRYHDDEIINHDVLSVDKNTIYSLFGQGKYASSVGWTNGLVTSTYGATRDNIQGAEIELILPFGSSTPPRLLSPFGSANNICVNVNSANPEAVLELQDWLSVKENHDLLSYGIEGEDWKADGDNGYEALSNYVFPGYVACWRAPLERLPAGTVESEKTWFAWSQDFDNFDLSPLAGFTLDQAPLETELAQLGAAYTEYALPLFAGLVDPTSGLSDLQRAFEGAGYEKALAETEKQYNAFLAGQ